MTDLCQCRRSHKTVVHITVGCKRRREKAGSHYIARKQFSRLRKPSEVEHKPQHCTALGDHSASRYLNSGTNRVKIRWRRGLHFIYLYSLKYFGGGNKPGFATRSSPSLPNHRLSCFFIMRLLVCLRELDAI